MVRKTMFQVLQQLSACDSHNVHSTVSFQQPVRKDHGLNCHVQLPRFLPQGGTSA